LDRPSRARREELTMPDFNKPLRGPKYRSRAFQEYMLRQPPERAQEILADELAFNELRADPNCLAQAAEREYAEDMAGPESKIGEGSGMHVLRKGLMVSSSC
jgi:hypothetical protein